MRDAELEAELEDLMTSLLESDLESERESEAPACNDAGLPKPRVTFRGVSAARVQCPTRAQAQRILNSAVSNAVQMLDNTIAELNRARQAACQGQPLGWPNLGDVTACWLKQKLGVCIDDLAVWTAGTFQSGSVAEVIRRLVRPRDLLANNEIVFVCDDACPDRVNAWTQAHLNGQCIAGSPDRIIHLCPVFWNDGHAPFREQTIIHETVHLTHCGEHGDASIGVSIGSPYCVAQFVAATNGRALDPGTAGGCGFTNHCGPILPGEMRRNCGGITGTIATPPDWHP
jgi:hypothetical protein